MLKYCFIIDEEKGLVQLGVGCPDEYYIEIGMQQRDVQQSDIDSFWYLAEKCPMKTEEEKFLEAKSAKFEENISKCNEKRYSQEFLIVLQDKECLFDSTEQTERDLMKAFLATADGTSTYPNWVCNNYVTIDLTQEDVMTVYQRMNMTITPLYTIQKQYAERIEACTTKEEVEAIEINYEVN